MIGVRWKAGIPGLALACCFGAPANELLTEAPELAVPAERAVMVASSRIAAVLRLPFVQLQQAAERAIPTDMSLGGAGQVGCVQVPYLIGPTTRNHRKCIDVPYCDFRGCGMQQQCVDVPELIGPSIGYNQQCADYHWNATVSPAGALQFSRNGGWLRAQLPLQIHGQAGLSGDLARVLSLSSKNMAATLHPAIDLEFEVDADWCPKVRARPTGDWVGNAIAEVIGRNCLSIDLGPLGRQEACAGPVHVDLSGKLREAIQEQWPRIQQEAAQAIPCGPVREQLSALWRPIAIPLQISGGERLYLNAEPERAALSKLELEDDSLRIAAALEARTSIGPDALTDAPLPLPVLQRAAESQSRLDLALPIAVPLERVQSALLAQVDDQHFDQQTALGTVRLRVLSLELRAVADAVVLALVCEITLPGTDTPFAATAHLQGRPSLEDNTLRVSDLAFTAVADQQRWSLLSSLLDAQVRQQLQDHAAVDLVPLLRRGEQALVEALESADIEGLQLQPGRPDLAIRGLVVRGDRLELEVSAGLDLAIELELQARFD